MTAGQNEEIIRDVADIGDTEGIFYII